MHDSAYRIGELVMRTYCDLPSARILELGSMNVNGSLRDAAAQTTEYIGLDFDDGPSVDVVIRPGEKLPVSDDSFDLVMASSVFEHDPCFWDTFIEMCRVTKRGGHIYLNAPSNGHIHRYPMDCWRFYPDAGVALADFARTRGVEIDLVESFIGKRHTEVWNDFVAIFRKGPTTEPLNCDFVHSRYPATNVRNWKSSSIENADDRPEDLIVIEELRQQIGNLIEQSAQTQLKTDDLSNQLAVKISAEMQIAAEVSELRATIAFQANGLRQREVEADQSLSEIARLREADALAEQAVRNLTEQLEALEASQAQMVTEINELQTTIDLQKSDLEQYREEAELQLVEAQSLDSQLIIALRASVASMRMEHQTFKDITFAELNFIRANAKDLSIKAQAASEANVKCQADIAWLSDLHSALARRPFWWFFLPRPWRKQREYHLLGKAGVFNVPAYLNRHPDVAASGFDPLQHYVTHGIKEGRDRAAAESRYWGD